MDAQRPQNDAPNREPENGAPRGTWTNREPDAPEGRRVKSLGKDRPASLELDTRASQVIKIARSHGLFYRCVLEGWDEDDLIQELLLRIHERQAMRSKYDPTKSAWGTYVYLVTKTVLMNLIEVQRTRNRREVLTDPDVISRWGDGSRLQRFDVGDDDGPRVVRGVPRYARRLVER